MKKQVKDKPFSRLSRAQKRIAIAKDVIKQIRAEKYDIQTGCWADINIETYDDCEDVEIGKQALLNGMAPIQRTINCRCCAVGAAFLSSIRLFNVATVQQGNNTDQDNAFDQLEKYFSKEQLDMIEEAFELGGGACHTESDKTYDFGSKYDEESDRALAIFRNIVRNKGKFKP